MRFDSDGFLGTDVSSKLPALGATALRISLGGVFLAHAYAKAAIFTFPGTERYFQAHALPSWSVYPVFAAELAGAAALLLGFRTRIAALALTPIMIGALAVHAPNGWMFTAPGGGWEYVAFLVLALLAQALLGDGAFAVARSPSERRPTSAESELSDAAAQPSPGKRLRFRLTDS